MAAPWVKTLVFCFCMWSTIVLTTMLTTNILTTPQLPPGVTLAPKLGLNDTGVQYLSLTGTGNGTVTEMRKNRLTKDKITGFGYRYYSIEVPVSAYVDTVVVVHRKSSDGIGTMWNTEACVGWSIYMTVNDSIPTPDAKYIDAPLQNPTSIQRSLVQLLQFSIFCELYSCARWSMKMVEAKKWWVMIQTRGYRGTEGNHNTTCHYSLLVDYKDSTQFLTGGILVISLTTLWLIVLVVTIAWRVSRSSWVFHRPDVALHDFIAGLPVLMSWAVRDNLRKGALWMKRKLCSRRSPPTPAASPPPAVEGQETGEFHNLSDPSQDASPTQTAGVQASTSGIDVAVDESSPTQQTTAMGNASPSNKGVHTSSADVPVNLDDNVSSTGTDDDTPCCRICRDAGSDEPLMTPCACQGSVKYVHSSCLNKWRQESLNSGRVENAVRCEICHVPFTIEKPPVSYAKICCSILQCGFSRAILVTCIYILTIHVTATFVKYTVAAGSCMAPYESPNYSVSLEHWLIGLLAYFFITGHLYLCIYWQWLEYVNANSDGTSGSGQARSTPFMSVRNVLWGLLMFLALLWLEGAVGLSVKYMVYVNVRTMTWTLDYPLCLGFVVLFLIAILGISVVLIVRQSGIHFLRLYHARSSQEDIGVVVPRAQDTGSSNRNGQQTSDNP